MEGTGRKLRPVQQPNDGVSHSFSKVTKCDLRRGRAMKSKLEGWREVRLGDIADVVGGGTPKTSVTEYWDGDIPWLTPKDLSNYKNRYISHGSRNISQLGLKQSSAKLVPKGTVLLTTRAPVGYLAIADAQTSTNQGFRSSIPNPDVNNIFLYYLLKNNIEYLKSQSGGSTFGELAGSTLKSLLFSFPPLREQKAIAEVLSSLDDKIDLLHRQNKTLEQMAETLFRQWFIVEANEDWKEISLGDYFPVMTGKKDANYSTDNGAYPFFTCAQKYLMAPGYSFDASAILLAGNGDFNVKRYCGKFEAYQRTYVLIPNDVRYFNFLFTLIKYYLLEITGGHQGSVINFITKGMITDFEIQMPPYPFDDKLKQFDSIFEKIDGNSRQINTLENLRNIALPKLMNGEVRTEHWSEKCL